MKIAVLLSGGVDSSVALNILKKEGHELQAFYLKIWLEDEMAYLGSCPWEEDLEYTQAVCDQLNISLSVVPFQKEYHEKVVNYTIDAVRKGLTPNPDVLCNSQIKFGAFIEKYGKDFDLVATGHYAFVDRDEKTELAKLKIAPDPIKDQTYFLAMITQEQLQKAIFPIGKMQKSEVRELAEKWNLPTAKRKDSQGICFLGKISFRDFLLHHLGKKKGKIIEKESGEIIGEHDGAYLYTIGQRRGIELSGGPWYVCDKNIEKNIVFVSHGFGGDDQRRDEFEVSNLNWISGKPKNKNLRVKLRHGEKFYDCEIDFIEDDLLKVKLGEKDQGITPGQFAVFYDGEYCLGGGAIV
ncbi:MAG: tRNA 2-thiouridine(34) synthase MnmA [Candidatus Moranbacteria bacterium]|nr:tRNA 2-thiouridine(34) synthase MnmA [Candidatus Moranbacteria bacterium]